MRLHRQYSQSADGVVFNRDLPIEYNAIYRPTEVSIVVSLVYAVKRIFQEYLAQSKSTAMP